MGTLYFNWQWTLDGSHLTSTSQPLTLMCFNTFYLEAENPTCEILADTKNMRWARHSQSLNGNGEIGKSDR
ncbi:hypothetical protein [Nostoc sp.]|uniref:hypothetical protein n=1 Tax=Nostoc sp. TaxID=1180 RepID=UPI002FFD0CD4